MALMEMLWESEERQKDRDLQLAFAKQGVGWRIKQGQKHGLSPMASIGGAGGPRYTPIGGGSPRARLSRELRGMGQRKKPLSRIGFINPARVVICARRRMRREVLHAFRKVGAGGGARFPRKKPRYNEWSGVVCYG